MKRPKLIAVFSDTHCNSTLGLMPEVGVKLPEGQKVDPSPAQRWLWDKWLDFWEWIAALRSEHRAELRVVCNGDAVDGTTHHGQTQFVTADEEAMMWLTEQVFAVPRKLLRVHKGKCWMLKGTRSHVGSSEQALARWWGAEREPITDAWARHVLKMEVYGIRIDFRHHVPTKTTRPWLGGNPANVAAAMILAEHVDAGHPYPHLAIRSHGHKYGDSYKNHKTRCVVTPAWQLATDFVHQVVPESIADIGGIAILVFPDGTYQVFDRISRPEPAPTYRD